MFNYSCMNGWGFGNIASTALDASRFFWEYLGTNNILSPKYQEIIKSDWDASGHFNYSLGLMSRCYDFVDKIPTSDNQNCWIGHLGMDWGSQT